MSDRKCDERGCPIMTLHEKLAALEYCIEQGWKEDALGHLFDLLHHFLPKMKIKGSVETIKGIKRLYRYYGKHPTPVLPNPADNRRS